MSSIPLDVGRLKAQVRVFLDHTRAVGDTELLAACNYGYGKLYRAAVAVRPQLFVTWKDDFQVLAGTSDYDVSAFDPPLQRPVRLLVGAGQAQGRSVLFRYRALTSSEFEAAELLPQQNRDVLFYDVLRGRLPLTATAVAASPAPAASAIAVEDDSLLPLGTTFRVLGAGPLRTIGDTAGIPSTYYGIVVGESGGALVVAPPFGTTPSVGAAVTPLASAMLRIVPQLNESLTGRLYYDYAPEDLNDATDDVVLPDLLAKHRDCMVAYALGQLNLAVNVNDAQRWADDAEEMRSEFIQHIEPLAQGTEHVGSGLDGIRDW